jgi:biotin carboxyl carrier protein
MKLEVKIGERTRTVELDRRGEGLSVQLDGEALAADVVEIAHGVYSILIDGRSFEARVLPRGRQLHVSTEEGEFAAEVHDPRAWRGRHGGLLEAAGMQQIVAPMPGKVVRVLVAAGEEVAAGQGLLVVEAMKMQNEVRSPKAGTVERVLAAEGQSVNSGDVLAVVS